MQDGRDDLREGWLRHAVGGWKIPIMVGGYSGGGDSVELITAKCNVFNKGTYVGPDGKKTVFTKGDGKIWWPKGQHPSGGRNGADRKVRELCCV